MGERQERPPTVSLSPWKTGTWDLGSGSCAISIWEGLLHTHSADQMFAVSASRGKREDDKSGVWMSRPGGTSHMQVASRKLWPSDALKIPTALAAIGLVLAQVGGGDCGCRMSLLRAGRLFDLSALVYLHSAEEADVC